MAAADHYRTLQVDRDADPEVVEKAYRVLALKHHPDVSDGTVGHARMARINEAYRVLSDPRLRAEYDARLPARHGGEAWELFLDEGLVGLFLGWARARDDS
ncbi:MAG: DnaJ domain-containing protein [Coriobacteriia bacterium]